MSESSITIDDDDSEEEEEVLVYFDLESLVSSEDLNSGVIKIIGIDDDHPIVQVNDKIFKGSYHFSMGTNLFFHKDEEAVDDTDPLFGPYTPLLYKYFGKSIKLVKMERIFVQPVDNPDTGPTATTSDETSKFIITKTYGEALNQLLGAGELPPRNLANDEHSTMEIDLRTSASTIIATKKLISGDDDDEDDPPEVDDPKDEDYVPYEMDVG